MNITRNLVTAVLMTIVTTVILGVIYPLAITGIAQVAFPDKANGQLITKNGKVIGSRSSRRDSRRPGYFRPDHRPPVQATTLPIRRARSWDRRTRSWWTRSRRTSRRPARRTRTRRCPSIS